MFRATSLGIVLFALWLLLSGRAEPLFVVLGILSSLTVVEIARRMDVVDREGHPIHLGGHMLTYWPWLMWKIARANIKVAKVILHPKLPIAPSIFRIKAGQRTELGAVIHANSITLTPGTLTLEIDGDEIEVHALTRSTAKKPKAGEMDRRISAMEGSS